MKPALKTCLVFVMIAMVGCGLPRGVEPGDIGVRQAKLFAAPVTESSLPSGRAFAGVVAANGYLYVVGGLDSQSTFVLNPTSTVYYAPIQSGGTLGSWSTTSSFSNARFLHGVATDGSNIWAVGGYDANSVPMPYVERAIINSDGTLSTWTHTTALIIARGAVGAAILNGRLYAVGGCYSSYCTWAESAGYGSDGMLWDWVSQGEPANYPGRCSNAVTIGSSIYFHSYELGGIMRATIVNGVLTWPAQGVAGWRAYKALAASANPNILISSGGVSTVPVGNYLLSNEFVYILPFVSDWNLSVYNIYTGDTDLAVGLMGHSAVTAGTKMYVLGGSEVWTGQSISATTSVRSYAF